MELNEAFESEQIEAAGTDLTIDEEGPLNEYLYKMLPTLGLPSDQQHAARIVEFAILSFVAGRTYQINIDSEYIAMADQSIELTFDAKTVSEFIQYLIGKTG